MGLEQRKSSFHGKTGTRRNKLVVGKNQNYFSFFWSLLESMFYFTQNAYLIIIFTCKLYHLFFVKLSFIFNFSQANSRALYRVVFEDYCTINVFKRWYFCNDSKNLTSGAPIKGRSSEISTPTFFINRIHLGNLPRGLNIFVF